MLLALFFGQLVFCNAEMIPQANFLADDVKYDDKDRINTTGTTVSLTLENARFYNHQDTTIDGGALYIATNNGRVNCSINNCLFESCKAQNGGAIYADYASKAYNLTITDSIFNHCEATKLGGALYYKNTQKLKEILNILRTTFTSNSANQGGAIYTIIRDQFVLQFCNFENNVATKGSSAYLSFGWFGRNTNNTEEDTFYVHDNSFKFTPSENNLINVYIESYKSTKEYVPISNVYLGGCTFSISGSTDLSFKQLQIYETTPKFNSFTFDKCNCVQQESSTVTIPNSFGSIYNFTFNCQSLDSCQPSDPIVKPPTDPASPPTEGDYETKDDRIVPTEDLTIIRTIFKNIKNPSLNGGAIFICNESRVNCNINDCHFESCDALFGGAIFVLYKTNKYEFTVSNTNFTGCQATECGGALYLKNTQYNNKEIIKILNCRITSNKAQKGGAIYAEIRDKLYIQDCTIENNEAVNGSSFFCILGQDNVLKAGENDELFINDTIFAFQPSENNKINVHIENKKITNTTEDGPSADLYLSGCTFSINGELIEGTKHLEITENDGGFKSINFDKCNCVKETETTFTIPNKFMPVTNAHFGCTSISTCKAAITPTPVPPPPTTPDVPPTTPDAQPTPDVTPDPNYKQETERIEEPLTTVTLKNVEFYKMGAEGIKGGAILFDKKRVNCSIDNCKFTQCKASNGGAIYIQYAGTNISLTGSITKSTFSYCNAKTDGGAIYLLIRQPKIQSFLIDQCTFISNNAGDQGGAIYSEGRDQLTIQKSTFDNNKAKNAGCSLYVQIGYVAKADKNDQVVINDCKFTFTPVKGSSNVYAQTPPNSQNYNYKNANLFIGGCTFSISKETDVEFKHLQIFEQLQFQSIKFTKCNCIQQGTNTVSVPDIAYPLNNFHFNCDPNGVCSPDTPITLPPPEGPDDEGYVPHDRIANQGQAIELEKAKFTSIKSNGLEGGAILIKKPVVNCNLVNCKFTSCSAKTGGAIYISYTGNAIHECTISQTSFIDCSATEKGGAIYVYISQEELHSVTIKHCTFTSNSATMNGGAICAYARDSFTVRRCTFENNQAEVGSSLWCEVGYRDEKDPNYDYAYMLGNTFSFSPKNGSINVFIKSYKLTNQTYSPNANLVLSVCSFSSVNPSSDNYKHLVIDDSEAKFNSIDFASCICVRQKKETVSVPSYCNTENIKFECDNMNSCGVDKEGYTIHDQMIDQEKPIDLENFKFLIYDNDDSNGGAISINKNKVNCTLKKCKFEYCDSQYGGAIYIKYTGDEDYYACTITNCVFENCQASIHGGAIYIQITQSKRHSATVTNCEFTNNVAKSNGGAIYADTRDRFTLTDCVFVDNYATNNGSSLWCRVGWNNKYNKNEACIQNNQFTFKPKEKGDVNVYISSYNLDFDITPNANLVFGGCTFNVKKSDITSFYHLKIYNYRSQFESINFTSCSCVKQGAETVDLPLLYNPEYYFTFECESMGSCTAKPGTPTPKPKPGEDGYYTSDRINRVEFDPKVVLTKVKFSNLSPENPNYYGGAIYLNKVPGLINDCKFEKCSSIRGGAFYVAYSGTYNNYTCGIYSCIFVNCNSTNGGAIYASIVQRRRHHISIEGCTFTENTAVTDGGALYATVRDCFTVRHCSFVNNKASNGCSVWCQVGQDQGTESDDRAVFYGNNFTFTPSESNTNNVYIQSNSLKNETSPNANIIIGKNTFASTNSNAQNYKHLEIKEVGKFQSIQFSDCNCIQGAESTVSIVASVKPSSTNLIYNCQSFDQCPSQGEKPPTSDECKSYPGRQESFRHEVSLERACFTNINAPTGVEGGAIRVVNAKLEAEDCRFTSCSSDSNGGAIYVTFSVNDCELELENCVFISCSSGSNGGAIYFVNTVPSCESSIKGCRFENNKAVNSAGAFYYSPCANSEMKKNLFINNTCTSSKAQGTSLYVYVSNSNQQSALSKKNKVIKDDEDENENSIKPVVIEENRFRSEPVSQTQQLFINLKKSGQLEFNSNSFSFNKAESIPNGAKYIQLTKDEGAVLNVKGEICVDNQNSLVSGFDSTVGIQTDCHVADSENDHTFNNDDQKSDNKNKNVGLIVGVTIAAVVVVVVIIVVVVIVVKKKQQGKYVSDLNNDDLADNNSMTQATDEPHNL